MICYEEERISMRPISRSVDIFEAANEYRNEAERLISLNFLYRRKPHTHVIEGRAVVARRRERVKARPAVVNADVIGRVRRTIEVNLITCF